MSKGLARAALTGYRVAGILLYPLVVPYLTYRSWKGKEDRARRAERLGHASAPRPRGPLVWAHSASVNFPPETSSVVRPAMPFGPWTSSLKS